MDPVRPVAYRNLQLNDASIGGTGERIAGIAVERIAYGGVNAYAYTEKRSNSDGFDAGEVFLGKREIDLTGTIYGQSRADLFDRKMRLVAAFTPTLAYATSPIDYGYLPLTFEEPTLNTDDWPNGYIPLMMRVRARSTPEFQIVRDAVGGEDARGLAIPWSVSLEAKDPRIYCQQAQQFYFSASPSPIDLPNRGLYGTPFRIEWPSNGTVEEKLSLIGLGSSMTLTIPASATPRTLYYDGVEKYVTLEQSGLESLRMDLLTFANDTTHPEVPPGGDDLSWSHTGGSISSEARLIYWEAWA